MLKIRRPLGRLIFNMRIAIPGKTVFLIETAPWSSTPKRMNIHQPSLKFFEFENKRNANYSFICFKFSVAPTSHHESIKDYESKKLWKQIELKEFTQHKQINGVMIYCGKSYFVSRDVPRWRMLFRHLHTSIGLIILSPLEKKWLLAIRDEPSIGRAGY